MGHGEGLSNRHLGYERVHLPLFKVADTPFHIQLRGRNIAPRGDIWTGLDPLGPLWATIMTDKYGDRQKPQDGIMNICYKRLDTVNRKSKTKPVYRLRSRRVNNNITRS